jgi:hypothetical protein
VWLTRNVRQVWEGGVRRFGSSRETVRSAMLIPSLTSSPWIRGAPHSGFAAAIRLTRAAISALTGGRPPVDRPERWVQCSRKRRRCHRRTVPGVTITRDPRHPVQTLPSPTQKDRTSHPQGSTSIGSVKQKVLPPPILLSAQIRPPCASTMHLEM